MKKQGFTLVELLAVIAILAILVIIALPNVMGMFNQAKENSFTTEIKTIFQQAEQQWISDSMLETGEITYRRVNGNSCSTSSNGSKIDLSGRTELNYEITLNQAGKVIAFNADDGTYILKSNLSTGDYLLVTDIGDENGTKAPITSAADGNSAYSYGSCS